MPSESSPECAASWGTLRRNGRGIWETRSSGAPFPSALSRVPSSPGGKHQGLGRDSCPDTLSGGCPGCASPVPPPLLSGPHSSRCPFKKEEILFINKRPNLSVQPAAYPAGFRVMGATSRQRTSPGAQPWEKARRTPLPGCCSGLFQARVRGTGGVRRRDLGEPRNGLGSVCKVLALHGAKGSGRLAAEEGVPGSPRWNSQPLRARARVEVASAALGEHLPAHLSSTCP